MRYLLPFAFLVTACAPLPPVPPASATTQHCPVCRQRRDFDCLVVDRSPRTPQASYAGRTHYFCSTGCRTEFLSTPASFWPPK